MALNLGMGMNKRQVVIGMILVFIMSKSDAKSVGTLFVIDSKQPEMTQNLRSEIKNNCYTQMFIDNVSLLNRPHLERRISAYQKNDCQYASQAGTSAFIERLVLNFSSFKRNVKRIKGKPKAHVFAAQKPKRVKLSCKGSKSAGWRIRMNLKKKRMRVNLKNVSAFSVPITYFRWSDDKRKHLKVIAGKGKKRVKATIDGSKSCRLDFSKRRYAYSISAKVARTTHLSGCCSDISR